MREDDEFLASCPALLAEGARTRRVGCPARMIDPVKAPERLETARLILRRPSLGDAHSIFTRYASDADVTRYLAWPRHQSIESTRVFLGFSDLEWASWPAGPYLIESRAAGTLLGSTGLGFETLEQAATGYVLARDAWGNGYATEALLALLNLCASLRLRRVHALVHLEHATSRHVLEKCGFVREPEYLEYTQFPNLGTTDRQPTVRYAKIF